MKLRLVCIGKLTEPWQRSAAEEYAGRLQHYFPFELVELKEEKCGRKADLAGLLRREGERLLEKVPEQACLIVLEGDGGPFHGQVGGKNFKNGGQGLIQFENPSDLSADGV